MLLLIDNYDSFTYNIAQALGSLGVEIKIFRHNKISLREIGEMEPEYIVISPGPKSPKESGISNDVIKYFYEFTPILGVCLGMQCMAYSFGGKIIKSNKPVHGKTSLINHNSTGIYKGLPSPLKVARYHSLIVEKSSMPPQFEITATSDNDEIMGIRMKKFPHIEGIQFHPESFMTEAGIKLFKNFLDNKPLSIKGKIL